MLLPAIPFVRTTMLGLLAAALSLPAVAAEPAWVTKSNTNAKVLLNVLAKYSPETASNLGVDGYDEQIMDLSRDQFDASNRDLGAAIAELQKRLRSETDSKIRQDLQILIDKAQDQLKTAALQRKYFMPYQDLTRMVYGVVRATLDPRIPPARQRASVRYWPASTNMRDWPRAIGRLRNWRRNACRSA